MSKEQKTLKSCYILDRLREWFELYGNQNHQRAEEELHLAIDELYEYQQKDQRIADLEARLAESEKLAERLQQIVDKLRDKEFAGKTLVEAVNAVYEPLYKNKYDEAEELKQRLNNLPKKIAEEIKRQMGSVEDILINCGNGKEDALCWFNECLDSILKKYGGEDD